MSRQGILQKIPGTSNSMKCDETGSSDLLTGTGLKTNPTNLESNAAGMVLRLALKTRFSEMGWGSTPLLSANNTALPSGLRPLLMSLVTAGFFYIGLW